MSRVAMFVTNPCTHDARVMKEAASLAAQGYEVRVFALANAHSPAGIFDQETYTVHRLEFANIFKRAQSVLSKLYHTVARPAKFLLFHLISIPFFVISTMLIGAFAIVIAPFSLLTRALRSGTKPDSAENDSSRTVTRLEALKHQARIGAVGLNFALKTRVPFKFRSIIIALARKGFNITIRLFYLSRRLFYLSRRLFYFARRIFKKMIAVAKKSWRKIKRALRLTKSKSVRAVKLGRRAVVRKSNRLIYVLLLPLHKFATYLFFCQKAAEQAIEWQPSFAHAHDLNTLYAANLVKKQTAAKVIYDSHELWIHRNRVGRKATVEKMVDKWAEKKLIKQADAVITVCDSIGVWLMNRYPDIPKPIILRNMPHKLENESDTASLKPLAERLGVADGVFTMIYTGKITTGRGIEIGIEAMVDVESLHFVLLGYGDETYVNQLKQMIDGLGLTERVTFCDPVPHTEVTSFIYGADFALVYIEPICLSYEYALPNKLFESIQAGIPILGSQLVEIEKLVEGKNLGVCFSSSRDLANKLQAGLDRTKLAEWRQSILGHQQDLCWDVEQRNLIELYESLAA